MPDLAALDRLQSQLLTSGVQERNNALFQVISQLIAFIRQNINATQAQISSITPSGGGGGSSSFQSTFPPGLISGYHGDTDGDIIIIPNINPGSSPCCVDGARGPMGPDGEDSSEYPMFQSLEAMTEMLASIEFTPALTNITLNDGTISGRYLRIGRVVFWNAILTWGAATTFGASPQIGSPFPALSGLNVSMCLYGSYFDSSAGTSYFANLVAGSASTILLTTFSGASALSGNTPLTNLIPFAWGTGDIVRVSGVMIAAG